MFPVPDSIRGDPRGRDKLLDLIEGHGIDVSALRTPAKKSHKKRLIDFESLGADKVVQDDENNNDDQILDITDLEVDAVKKMNKTSPYDDGNMPRSEAVKDKVKTNGTTMHHPFIQKHVKHLNN